MNKNDITSILTSIELSETQIKALLDMNSADITKALNKQKDEITSTKQALSEAQATIADLEKNKGDVAKLQEQIDSYKAADAQRQKEAKEAEEKAELEGRFAALLIKTFENPASSAVSSLNGVKNITQLCIKS